MHIRRAAVTATPETDTPSSDSLALLPLLSIGVLILILLFLSFRLFRRSLHLPKFTWLRGKGQGAKGRLGLSGVELLPTSLKAAPIPSSSPYAASFNLQSNAGKDGNTSLLSRSSSLDAFPQFVEDTSSLRSTHAYRSKSRSPFVLPSFLRSKRRSLHRRSKSLSVPVRSLTPPSTSYVTGSSAPSTPSSQPLLIDFTSSNSSSSTSSDLGAHKFPSGLAPLIPGIPIPATSPIRPSTSKSHTFAGPKSRAWAFDDDNTDDEVEAGTTDPLITAFKCISQHSEKAQPQIIPINYVNSSSTILHTPIAPSLAPQRLSTANPFASFTPSSAAHPSQLPFSPSPLSLLPPSPSGIQLVPLKTAPVATDNSSIYGNLLGPDDNKASGPITDLSTTPALASPFEPLIVSTTAGLSDASSTKSPGHPSVDVLQDPFDDVHAITLGRDLDGVTTELLTEQPLAPSAESTKTVMDGQDIDPQPQPSSTLIPSLPDLVPIDEVVPHVEPEPLVSSWQWDDTWGSVSPPAAPPASSELLTLVPPIESGPQTGALGEKEGDLITFDQGREYSSGVESSVAREPLAVFDSNVGGDMDPADTWFVEESTAVWDTAWSEAETKTEPFSPEAHEIGSKVDEEETVVLSPEQLAVAKAEPLEVHMLEQPRAYIQDLETRPHDFQDKHDENENNDIHEHDAHDSELDTSNTTMVTSPVKSLLSTPVTPTSPHVFLPPHASLTIPTVVETSCPDPDLLPLPELPLLSTPSSPVALSSQLAKPNSPSSLPLAQTPTPPASPPPIYHAPVWQPPTAADISSPGIHAAAITMPPDADSEAKAPGLGELEGPANVIELDDDDRHIDLVNDGHVEARVAQADTLDPSIGESEDRLGQPSADRPTTPQPALSTDLPGSFPSLSEPVAPISPPPPAHLSLLPRTVPSASHDNISTAAISADSEGAVHAVQRRRRAPNADSNHLRAPRSALDLALAMQLRPGLGAGADPAWMVRFLMALFGWVAMLASGDMQ